MVKFELNVEEKSEVACLSHWWVQILTIWSTSLADIWSSLLLNLVVGGPSLRNPF
uniref:Uncharacterized protein n=1 Tax=Manihot esculenta TaxID=3983 RepID=A0A251K9S7_MANES